MKRVDVAIVGGGPAGLAAGIEAARRGLQALVLERQLGPPDKACGEGLMPRGVAELERLGARPAPEWASPFVGIRYLQPGATAEARFASGPGLGIRRLGLSQALRAAATAAGVELWEDAAASDVRLGEAAVTLAARDEAIEARVLVAADGLASPLRHALGLEAPAPPGRRFGLRRHFQVADPGEWVEVHWAEGVEAYLTPAGPGRLGVALLFERGDAPADFEALLAHFPAVQARLAGAAPDSALRGSGPLARRARAVVRGRAVLLGDAAGYVDAITGEGLSLAFQAAAALGAALPAAAGRGGGERALRDYARAHARLFRRYALSAGTLLWLSRRPRLRAGVVAGLARFPAVFAGALEVVA